MKKIRMVVDTGFVGAEHEEIVEVTEEDLKGITLETYCEEFLKDMLNNCVECYWEEVTE